MLHILQYLASSGFLLNFVTQTSIAHLPKDKFETVPIPRPPLTHEQQAIAEALSDADALIEGLESLIAKKRQLKQGAVQELLTPKDSWEPKKLSELAEIRSGGTPSTINSQYWDGNVLWSTPTDITALKGRKYLSNTYRKITALGLKNSSAELIPSRSIVMTSRATIGECAINTVPVSTNQGFKNFVPYPSVDVEFLYYLLLTKKQAFVNLCGGSTFLEISKGQLLSFELSIPTDMAEQMATSTILSDMDTEISALVGKLTKARRVKEGMMQDLLTGRVRLV
jgi:type I restriction enzyme S subunit